MVDTDDTRRTTDDGRRTTDDGRRTTPRVWHKLPTGELKKEIFKAMKFQTIKNTKFYSSEIKWFYSMAYCVISVPSVNKPDQSVVAYCVVFSYKVRSVCYGLLCCFVPFR